MSHPTGEHLRCNVCGAEIVYVRSCPCPDADDRIHPDVCCDEEMESLGVDVSIQRERPAALP